MISPDSVRAEVLAVLERDTAINLHEYPIVVAVDDNGRITLEGEVQDIIAKRHIPHLVAGLAGVREVLNHLHVRPTERRGDGAIQDAVFQALAGEPVFSDYPLVVEGQKRVATRTAHGTNGIIEISVKDAVVTLTGTVESLSHKRLADVLSWWVMGPVDVRNRLHVVPPEQGTDDEITDVLRMVLEKDPWLDAGQIAVHTRNQKISLYGLVRSPEQKHMAECNAWLILGVHGVDNHIEVQP